MKSLLELQNQRTALIEKIGAQRQELAEIYHHFKSPLALIDKGIKVVRFVRGHPALAGGSVLAFWALRQHGILGLVKKGWQMAYVNPSILSYGTKLFSRFRSNKTHEAHH